MIVMPSNNTGSVVKALFSKYPGRIALLQNPHRLRPHAFQYPYAMDNAAFSRFNERQFFKMLDFATEYATPMFVTCPDVVGCHDRTIALWQHYYPLIKRYGYPIAFVAQDGCVPDAIPRAADWVFVGGNDPWKMDNIHRFVGKGRPVHVGRVNSIARLKYCESIGVASVDGTGWMRAKDRKFYDLLEWFSGEETQLCIPF
jgi:hypothetical protein